MIFFVFLKVKHAERSSDFLNEQYPNIKFTIEKEKQSSFILRYFK